MRPNPPVGTVVTRFPPSPTGFLHLGGARTALFNFFFAKKAGGKIFLRLEDTDRARVKPAYEKDILDALAWLGLTFENREPWRQSDRQAVYERYLTGLLAAGKAYRSVEETGERREVIRFKNSGSAVTFSDLIRGEIVFDTKELGDFIIAKSPEEPLYHLAVVVDDYEMGVTHVIRGEDHISNTPRQILLQEALNFSRPQYAHIPLILAPDRSKLSKRHGAVSVNEYRARGYLPEALVNYLALLGWNPRTDQEIFTLPELISAFDLAGVQKGGAVFNEEKLRWVNRQHIARLPVKEHIAGVTAALCREHPGLPQERLRRLVPVLIERIHFFGEAADAYRSGELSYFFEPPRYDAELLLWKGERNRSTVRTHLLESARLLGALPVDGFTKEAVRGVLFPYADRWVRGVVLWAVRVALSGRRQSPDPFTIAAVIGKEDTVARLTTGADLLS